jgi:hypothetical protein
MTTKHLFIYSDLDGCRSSIYTKPKKDQTKINLTNRSHNNHIHLKIARHGSKQKVKVHNTIILSFCHEQSLDTNWIELEVLSFCHEQSLDTN